MPRPRLTRDERKQQTREGLLDAAALVFSQRGFHGASVDDVAGAAGFTKGAVYAHFANKEDLFLALLDRRLEEDRAGWDTVGGRVEPGGAAGTRRSFARELEEQRTWNLLLLEFFQHAMRDELVRDRLAGRYQALRETLAGHLALQFAAGGRTPRYRSTSSPG
jgi:AcrR family transcriptional regulator